ncbi:MAG: hypothetical protein AAF943_16555 [Pseudomonadota bacterium]
MRFKAALVATTLLTAGSPAVAGAWLRAEDSGFASFTFGATQDDRFTTSLYLEYGLWPETTVGLDANVSTLGSDINTGSALVFLRRAIGPTDRPLKLSYELSLGALRQDERTLPAAEATVSVGRGLQIGERNGWVNIDASYLYEPTRGDHLGKLDVTAGLDFTRRTTGVLELNYSAGEDDDFGAIEPSVLFRLGGGDTRVRLGAQIPWEGSDDVSLELGLWRDF